MRQLTAGANERGAGSARAKPSRISTIRPCEPRPRACRGRSAFADGRGGETPALLFTLRRHSEDVDLQNGPAEILPGGVGGCDVGGAQLEQRHQAPRTFANKAARSLSPAAGPIEDNGKPVLLDRGTRRSLHRELREKASNGGGGARRAPYAEELRTQPRLESGTAWSGTQPANLLDFLRKSQRRGRERVGAVSHASRGAMATLPVALSGLAWCEILRRPG